MSKKSSFFKFRVVKIEIVTTLIVFRQYNQFDTDFIQIIYRLSTDYLHIMYRLSTDYLQVLLYKNYILTICRLSTDYMQDLHNRKIDYFGTEIHLFRSKNGCG